MTEIEADSWEMTGFCIWLNFRLSRSTTEHGDCSEYIVNAAETMEVYLGTQASEAVSHLVSSQRIVLHTHSVSGM